MFTSRRWFFFSAHFQRPVRYTGMLGSGHGPLLSRCLEPSSPSARQFGSGFHRNRPSTYPSLGSPTRHGDQTLVPRPFASPATPRRSSRSANILKFFPFSAAVSPRSLLHTTWGTTKVRRFGTTDTGLDTGLKPCGVILVFASYHIMAVSFVFSGIFVSLSCFLKVTLGKEIAGGVFSC